MPPPGLGDRSAIVTGGAGGLGKSIASKLLLAGGRVTVVDQNAERLDSAWTELSKQAKTPESLMTIKADITSEEQVKMVMDAHVKKFGGLDVLVNNAGVMDRFDPVGDTELVLWNKVLAVNLTGPMLMSKYAIERMQQNKKPGGVILNIGSTASILGFRAGAAYTASKHGLIGLTKNTAAFYGQKNIRCNALLPGGMETNIGDAYREGPINREGWKTMESTAAMKPPITDPFYMSHIAQFLISDAAKAINGACVAADQGWSAY